MTRRPRTPRALVAGFVLSGALVSGGMLMQSGAWSEADATPGSPRLFDQVMARVSRDFIDTLTKSELYERAAAGFVKEIGDPYSVLLPPDRFARLRDAARGRYPGIGVELDIREGFVTIIAPLAETPAERAGIKAGDRIMAINGKATHGFTIEEVEQALRGPSGSSVRLSLERGDEHPVVTLTREEIDFHPVQRAELFSGGIGYVELATFSERAAADVERAVNRLRAQGARSLILDLRANPGGLLQQGVAVADLFLDRGQTIASTRGRTPETNEIYEDQSPQRWIGMPVVALVDSGSASAAEIVAGALQDNGRAVLVGSETYGKGSAQSIFPVAGGRAVKLSTARWFTPNGRTIDRDSTRGGITPDVAVETVADTTEPDAVVERAIQLLTGVRNVAELRERVSARRDRNR